MRRSSSQGGTVYLTKPFATQAIDTPILNRVAQNCDQFEIGNIEITFKS